MKLKKLLQDGYFPKELPPPFHTKSFGEKSRFVISKWQKLLADEQLQKPGELQKDAKNRFNENFTQKYGSSKLIEYSISKGVYSRRKLEIPNPKQYLDLSQAIVDNWKIINDTYKISSYSESKPVLHKAKRSIRTKSKSWNNFKFELIEKSFNRKVELKIDISNFYPTIYTHSIPWGLLGKVDAKKYFKIKNSKPSQWATLLATDPKAQTYRVADFIDTLVRNCNERQSIGIPIGPDTSFLLAELIGCRIDFEIHNKINKISHECIRYYDDYFFYVDTHGEAENILKIVQRILYDFQLETNENKVGIKEIPLRYIENWSITLSNFKFQNNDKYELRNYFTILYSIVDSNKGNSSWIINYGLTRFEYGNVKIKKENWQIFLSLLLQTILIDPSNIKQIFKIILSYKTYVNPKSKERIASVLDKIITEHISLNHSFEVSWSLWFYKSFNIKCKSETISSVLKSHDEISKLVALDLIDSKLFLGKKPTLTELAKSLTSQSLFDEHWILAYEAYKKNWLDFKGRNILSSNDFFNILNYYDISFYDVNLQLKTEFIVRPPIEFGDPFGDWPNFQDVDDDDDDDDDDDEGGEY